MSGIGSKLGAAGRAAMGSTMVNSGSTDLATGMLEKAGHAPSGGRKTAANLGMPIGNAPKQMLSLASGIPRADLKMLSKPNRGMAASMAEDMQQGLAMNSVMSKLGNAQYIANSAIQNKAKQEMAVQDLVNNIMNTNSKKISEGGKPAQ